MILRLLAFGVAVFLVYRLIRWLMDHLGPYGGPSDPGPAPDQPIVPCKACGTFVPRDEAIQDEQGRTFCSPACQEKEVG